MFVISCPFAAITPNFALWDTSIQSYSILFQMNEKPTDAHYASAVKGW